MEKNSKTRSGTLLVFFFFFLAIAAISSIEAVLFYGKFKSIDTYEAMHNAENHISRVVARLGNTFDLVVIGGRLEQTTVNILHNDVDRINGEIDEMVATYGTASLASSNKVLADDLKGVPNEWRKIYDDIKTLSINMNHDKLLLIHNDIDIDVIVLDERLDRISAGINTALQKVLRETKVLLLVTLAGFVLMLITASIFLYSRFISPLRSLEFTAREIASGREKKLFVESMGGAAGRLARVLNTINEEHGERLMGLKEVIADHKSTINEKERAIKALGDFFITSGSSFNSKTLSEGALLQVPELTGAGRAFVYLFERGVLLLKAAVPAGGTLSKDLSILPEEARGSGSGELIDLSSEAGAVYPPAMRRGGKWLKSFALAPGEDGDYGRLLLLFRSKPPEDSCEFTTALAAALGTSVAFIKRLQEEHDAGKDSYRLINQLPYGVAVFEKGGTCILVNLLLKRFLGSAPDFDFSRSYTFVDDDVFKAQGLVTTINKSYDGFITEFIINYDPYLVKRYGFMCETRDLKIKSFPLYEPDGTIFKIALLLEDITLSDEPRTLEDKNIS